MHAPDPITAIRAGATAKLLGVDIPPDEDQQTPLQRRLVSTWGDGVRRWDLGVCRVCAGRMPTSEPVEFMGAQIDATVCDGCASLVAEHYEPTGGVQQQTRRSWWRENCPPLYQRLVFDGLPAHCDLDAMRRVRSWRPGGRGLILLGESGAGKTTSLWALAHDLDAEGITPVFVTAVELARAMGKSAYDLRRDHWLTGCRVLMIDDLGKEKVTAAVAALLWELVETRYAHERPVVLSTRWAGDEFEARFGEPHLGRDIRRRLAESCSRLAFRPSTGHNVNQS